MICVQFAFNCFQNIIMKETFAIAEQSDTEFSETARKSMAWPLHWVWTLVIYVLLLIQTNKDNVNMRIKKAVCFLHFTLSVFTFLFHETMSMVLLLPQSKDEEYILLFVFLMMVGEWNQDVCYFLAL